MANDTVVVTGNSLVANPTGQVMVVAYPNAFTDKTYNPYPRRVFVSANRISGGGDDPALPGGAQLKAAFGGALPPVLWDGLGPVGEVLSVDDGVGVLSLNLPRQGAGFDQARPAPAKPRALRVSIDPAKFGAPAALDAAAYGGDGPRRRRRAGQPVVRRRSRPSGFCGVPRLRPGGSAPATRRRPRRTHAGGGRIVADAGRHAGDRHRLPGAGRRAPARVGAGAGRQRCRGDPRRRRRLCPDRHEDAGAGSVCRGGLGQRPRHGPDLPQDLERLYANYPDASAIRDGAGKPAE